MPRSETLPIVWLPNAVRNRIEQLAYIGERNPAAAIRMGDVIAASVARIGVLPESARPGRVAGTRELIVSGTPFIIVYGIEPDMLVILRVLHHRQRWPISDDPAR